MLNDDDRSNLQMITVMDLNLNELISDEIVLNNQAYRLQQYGKDFYLPQYGDAEASEWKHVTNCPIACPMGPPGLPGQDGKEGQKGMPGNPGSPGEVGTTGPKGQTGMPGSQGSPGEKGATGPQGQDGMPGNPGSSGEQGPKGQDGQKGTKGSKGSRGSNGKTKLNLILNLIIFFSSASLSWSSWGACKGSWRMKSRTKPRLQTESKVCFP